MQPQCIFSCKAAARMHATNACSLDQQPCCSIALLNLPRAEASTVDACCPPPGKPSAAQHTQQHAEQHPRAAAPPAPPVPAPPPKHPAWGGAGVAHAVPGGAVAAGVRTNSISTLPHPTAERSAEAPANSRTNSMPNTPSGTGQNGQADAAQKHVYDQQQQEPTPQAQQQVPALQPQQVQPQPAQAQALQQQQPHAPQQRLPPGFAPQQRQSRPCHFMTLRGFCPMGDRCTYDHPARPGADQGPWLLWVALGACLRPVLSESEQSMCQTL